MAILVNQQLVPAPPVARLRYGLFTAAQGPLTLDVRGIGAGIQFLSDHCGGAAFYDANCDTHPAKVFVEGTDLMEANPFWVYAAKNCGLVGRTPSEMEAAVRQQLIAGEQQVVEATFWNGGPGVTPIEPSLEGASSTTVVTTATGFGARIAALEEAFYDASGYIGTIHINTRAYAAAAYAQILEHSGAQLVTPIGSVWSFGSGYDITGPAGVAPAAGSVWAFMTSQVTRWQSDIAVPDVRQTINRETNQYTVVAERVHALTYDCPDVFAIEVPIEAPMVVVAP
jgi:hypothetical protein